MHGPVSACWPGTGWELRRCRALPAAQAVETSCSRSVIQKPGGSAAASACAPVRSVDSATAATAALVGCGHSHAQSSATAAGRGPRRRSLDIRPGARRSHHPTIRQCLSTQQRRCAAARAQSGSNQCHALCSFPATAGASVKTSSRFNRLFSCSSDRPTIYRIRLEPFYRGSHIMLKAESIHYSKRGVRR